MPTKNESVNPRIPDARTVRRIRHDLRYAREHGTRVMLADAEALSVLVRQQNSRMHFLLGIICPDTSIIPANQIALVKQIAAELGEQSKVDDEDATEAAVEMLERETGDGTDAPVETMAVADMDADPFDVDRQHETYRH